MKQSDLRNHKLPECTPTLESFKEYLKQDLERRIAEAGTRIDTEKNTYLQGIAVGEQIAYQILYTALHFD